MLRSLQLLVVTILIQSSVGFPPKSHSYILPPPPPPECPPPFPQSFSFGVASGAIHIEGGWDEHGKGENIWDRWIHTNPDLVVDQSNADVSAYAYGHLEEDVEILNNLTVRHYKFSLSWARILPDGTGQVNKAAILHYQRLLQLLRENQIEPIVSLYHNDLPQCLQEQGGFLCDNFPLWFAEYAKVCFEHFGPSVKYWITFNNPALQCNGGYGDGTFAPGVNDNPGINDYICGHNLLKAHAEVYHLYDDCYRSAQKGKISIALDTPWYEPDTDCETDIEAAETKLQFRLGWFAHPIYIGDYPQVMIDRIGHCSELQGLCESRLPRFTRKEIEWVRDTHDFFSINFYGTERVKHIHEENCFIPSYEADIGVQVLPQEGDVTYGIKKLILWVKDNYHNPSIFITEDGFGTYDRELQDQNRVDYIHDILVNIRQAMINDDARVYGYTYYSYIDGWEWLEGYTLKYGLYDIEFDCPTKTRLARQSAAYYQFVSKFGCICDPCPPKHHHVLYYEY